MRSRGLLYQRLSWSCVVLASVALLARQTRGSAPPPAYQIRVDTGHPWRPPFGLDRIGRPITVVVDATAPAPESRYRITALFQKREVGRYPVAFPATPPYSARVVLDALADELVLSSGANSVELAREAIHLPELEAEANVNPDTIVNPVDLGTILVPSGWLLLGPAQSASLELAVISRSATFPGAELRAAFESAPARSASAPLALTSGRILRQHLRLPEPPHDRNRDSLKIVIDDGTGRALWQKTTPVMIVSKLLAHPRFGATCERLRYDASISLRDPATGSYSTLSYENGWQPELRDVVVWLPNGGRFVFWRGSSYIPFWAGLHNTGLCYEWAEIISQPAGAVDCVEPLMDKELRYSNVEIVESTAARVHVRWRYQSTDFNYKVWGDEAVEDYYFYPDGFGTRVVNLRADPKNDYELSEFIILTPQGAYPLDVLPKTPVEALFLDGRKLSFRLPNPTSAAAGTADLTRGAGVPAIYRLRLHDDEPMTAICFNHNQTELPPVIFAPFFDKGQMVTPCYWGSHWPLARGHSTGRTIDDRIQFTPCHNSLMSWAGTRPKPIRTAEFVSLDTLGRTRPMLEREWVWLIGMTELPERNLLDIARSFATPPSLEIEGARLGPAPYAPERRSILLADPKREITLAIKPVTPWVNPVLEWTTPRPGPISVTVDDWPLESDRLASDGHALWLNVTIEKPCKLRIRWGS